ncbi:hypothetical protein KEJ13_09220 [Candidatus Bathyarchaeota archaeon]|nr:hypothetical protein [Candidatus Bathyarchaeota archaeon]
MDIDVGPELGGLWPLMKLRWGLITHGAVSKLQWMSIRGLMAEGLLHAEVLPRKGWRHGQADLLS